MEAFLVDGRAAHTCHAGTRQPCSDATCDSIPARLLQVMKWRRTYDCPPPPLPVDSPFQKLLRTDERYIYNGAICAHQYIAVPDCESLQDTCKRVEAVWEDTIAPALREGKNVLVVSHGNTLRALVKASALDRSRTLHPNALGLPSPSCLLSLDRPGL